MGVLYVGGNWDNGSNAGLWYLNGNNDTSNSNSNIGARLSFEKINPNFGLRCICPCPLAKNSRKEHALVGFGSKRREAKRKALIMKRIGYLYEKICDRENIKAAIRNASKGKRDREYVRRISENADYYADEISEMLKSKNYTFHPNRHKTIKDGASLKERDITIPVFYPDQIIHWAVVQVLQPIFTKGMYRYSCGSVPRRGGIYAKNYIEKVQRKKDARYVLKLDIRKFFPSVPHSELKKLLARKIKDKDTLSLLYAIIDNGGEGLPIGYYTSQWFSNFYLQWIDHYIKETLKIKYYVRYVDDMVLIDPNKRKLRKAMRELSERLKGYGLKIKENWQLWKRYSRPIDFVGYRFYEKYTLLRKRLLLRLMRTVKRISQFGLNIQQARRFNSLIGWGTHINFRNFYVGKIKPTVSKGLAKRYISRHDKRRADNVHLNLHSFPA